MKSLSPIIILLVSFVILCTGHGLQTILVPARATMEGYSSGVLGMLMSSYYLGFIAGSYSGPALISRVGHVNVFAASAAGACAVLLCFPLMPEPFWWLLLRFIYGICLVHFYTVVESWLNSVSSAETRGKILSVYMLLSFMALTAGQLLFTSTHADGYEMFSIGALLIALSLVPLLLSRIRRPDIVPSPEPLNLRTLYRASPLGVAAALAYGLISGAFWGMSAPFVLGLGYAQQHIAWFIAASMAGGFIAQWPLGTLSDKINRRWVILLAGLIMCASSLLLVNLAQAGPESQTPDLATLLFCGALFGVGFHPLYALCIAHTNDFLSAHQFVKASATLIFVQSVGAIAGATFAGLLMGASGNESLFEFIAITSGVLCVYSLLRLFENRLPKHVMPFRFFTRTSTTVLALDPRAKEPYQD